MKTAVKHQKNKKHAKYQSKWGQHLYTVFSIRRFLVYTRHARAIPLRNPKSSNHYESFSIALGKCHGMNKVTYTRRKSYIHLNTVREH
jgi:hypothetical protein